MRFNLKEAFESILEWGKRPDKDDDNPVSMVLLLREPKFSTLDQLRLAAERAFGTSFTGDKTVAALRDPSRSVHHHESWSTLS